jgi:hypothetical protein
MTSTASFTIPRTGSVFTDVAALLRMALSELERAGHGACTLAGKVGDAWELAKRLAKPSGPAPSSVPPKGVNGPSSPRGKDEDTAPPVKDPAETARVAISVGTLDAMLAAVKALGLTCKTSSTGTMRKALQAVVDAAAPKAPPVPPALLADNVAPLSTREALKLGKDALVKVAANLGVPTGELTVRGAVMKLAAAVSKASGYAVEDKATAGTSNPPAGTVLIADGKGGFRAPTASDAPALLALLDSLTKPVAA